MINTEIVTETQYFDAAPAIGSHEYYVTALYDQGESEPSNVVTILITDMNEFSSESIAVYPNPSNGIFTIEMPNMVSAKVMVMDITGKIVYDNNVISNSQIKLQNVEQGMYFIRIADTTSGSIVVKKLLVN